MSLHCWLTFRKGIFASCGSGKGNCCTILLKFWGNKSEDAVEDVENKQNNKNTTETSNLHLINGHLGATRRTFPNNIIPAWHDGMGDLVRMIFCLCFFLGRQVVRLVKLKSDNKPIKLGCNRGTCFELISTRQHSVANLNDARTKSSAKGQCYPIMCRT